MDLAYDGPPIAVNGGRLDFFGRLLGVLSAGRALGLALDGAPAAVQVGLLNFPLDRRAGLFRANLLPRDFNRLHPAVAVGVLQSRFALDRAVGEVLGVDFPLQKDAVVAV